VESGREGKMSRYDNLSGFTTQPAERRPDPLTLQSQIAPAFRRALGFELLDVIMRERTVEQSLGMEFGT